MDLRTEFVMRAINEKGAFLDLCREYGISAKTGYKWKQRFLERGMSGMGDASRRPLSSPSELGESVACEIVRLKQAHLRWGPKKIRELYQRVHPAVELPSESSFKRVLERAGLVEHRRLRPARDCGRIQSRLVAKAPNELWTVDFKGWWYTPGRQRCEPLTVRDSFSRYVLNISIPADARTETVQGEFERLFRCYGLPGTIRSDNGRPFAVSTAPLGLSRLSVWWLSLGISLDRTDPGHPEQNGSHERMHRDLACEVQGQIEGDLKEHEQALELWRREYNEQRPHEALQMRCPAELYQNSSRPFTGTPDRVDYPPDYLERQVAAAGTIQIDGAMVRITGALRGWNVGLKWLEPGLYALYFGTLCLGRVDVSGESFRAAQPKEDGQ
jgi:transposase InsO family protein